MRQQNMENQAGNRERLFSLELKSKAQLENITVNNNSPEAVLIEGVLGELKLAGFAEGIILEVVCSNGTLRVDLGEDEITKIHLKEVGGETT
jgi:hypothetical protein